MVETVGIGQSETAVADMTDFFLVLMIPGAGDELQGLKKGIVELADMIAVNKADGENVETREAGSGGVPRRAQYSNSQSSTWSPPVITYSALMGNGIDEIMGSNSCTQGEDDGLGRIGSA